MSYRSLPYRSLPWLAGLALGVTVMTMSANAEDLKSEIAPTGKLRVAIGISAAGGAFWSNKSESGAYVGVPVDLGKDMAAELGVPVEYVAYPNSGQITDAWIVKKATRFTRLGVSGSKRSIGWDRSFGFEK